MVYGSGKRQVQAVIRSIFQNQERVSFLLAPRQPDPQIR
ncbi:uncharacterized protein METZ01_LOCUS273419, partial [marine metagenome]